MCRGDTSRILFTLTSLNNARQRPSPLSPVAGLQSSPVSPSSHPPRLIPNSSRLIPIPNPRFLPSSPLPVHAHPPPRRRAAARRLFVAPYAERSEVCGAFVSLQPQASGRTPIYTPTHTHNKGGGSHSRPTALLYILIINPIQALSSIPIAAL